MGFRSSHFTCLTLLHVSFTLCEGKKTYLQVSHPFFDLPFEFRGTSFMAAVLIAHAAIERCSRR